MPSSTLFHVCAYEAAEAILSRGFRDGHGTYGTDVELCGVWLSDRPLDANEGAWGDAVLAVNFSVPLTALADYEVIEEGRSYREWCVPARVICEWATVSRANCRSARALRRC
jgi:hypothetical protein